MVVMGLGRNIRKSWRSDEVRRACKLYLVTDPRWLKSRSLASCVAEAIVGGVTCVQVREKGASTLELAKIARSLAPVCRVANIPLIVNDDIEAAKMAGADGVHVGQSDAACEEARAQLGDDAIVGVSVSDVAEALAAVEAGASYVGVGAMFSTMTKSDAVLVSLEMLEAICAAVPIPVVAIGGIDASNVGRFAGSGVSGIAVVSAILAAPDIEKSAEVLSAEVERTILDEGASDEKVR